MTTPHRDSRRWAIVGAGRMGTAIVAALRAAGQPVAGPFGRGADADGSDVAILCVPDGEIARAAGCLVPGVVALHVSGATTLAALAPHAACSVHPLMTVPPNAAPNVFAGAPCAVAADSPSTAVAAHDLVAHLGMVAFDVADDDRAVYHAAASIASNFLVTLEVAAERAAANAGVPREALVPLVRATVENWAQHGVQALTGPIARGDTVTVARQRAALTAAAPELIDLFDALADATYSLVLATAGKQAA